jgi:isorenieratene synthase
VQEHRLRPSSPERRLGSFGRALPIARAVDDRPDWVQADPAWIRRALASSQRLPSGGWYVLDDRRSISGRPRSVSVNGRELVVFRHASGVLAAPDACPHLGASLGCGRAEGKQVVCPWHGLKLGPRGHGAWRPLPTFDDGVLLWIRLDGTEPATDAPILPRRPERHVDAVIRVEAACEPRDVIANRLDPWHGAHFHPHSFSALRVIDQQADEITVRVVYRVLGPLGVEVDARFHCADPRTIVMTIVRGEGEGSVVETHATPIGPGRTAICEATLASSDRQGFRAARRVAPLLRPLLKWASRRLWADDAPYAERLYELRSGRDEVPR